MKHPILLLCVTAGISGIPNFLNAAEHEINSSTNATPERSVDVPATDQGWPDLEQLARIKVSTVARKELEVRKTAAAVHVITSEDIRRSGAN